MLYRETSVIFVLFFPLFYLTTGHFQGGFPDRRYLSIVWAPTKTPMNATVVTVVIQCLFGLLFLASYTAINAVFRWVILSRCFLTTHMGRLVSPPSHLVSEPLTLKTKCGVTEEFVCLDSRCFLHGSSYFLSLAIKTRSTNLLKLSDPNGGKTVPVLLSFLRGGV